MTIMGAAKNEADTKLIQQARIIYSTSRCSSDNNSDVERNDSRIYCEETKEDESDLTRKKRISRFFRKYFLEGQRIDRRDERGPAIIAPMRASFTAKDCARGMPMNFLPQTGGTTITDSSPIVDAIQRHRKLGGFLFPFAFMHVCWWTLAIRYNVFRLYPTHFEMPLTMVLGATVAGMTSEGGGAVAFPVMTLLLKIDPTVARDFSLMIQSCGMTSAAFTIIWMGIKIEWNTIILGSIGALNGVIFGLEFLDRLLTGSQKKMLFVAVWFSFGLSLFMLNSQKKRTTFENIQRLNFWKCCVLFAVGFVGGICSAFAGSGVDICAFSLITLFFRISEKVATPTSVVLMGINTCVGFFWRQLIQNNVSQLAWDYFSVSVPVVVICAPMGSLIASHFHRLVLATFVYVLEIVAVIGFLLTRPDPKLVFVGISIIFASFLMFLGLSCLGKYLHADLLQQGTTPHGRRLQMILKHRTKRSVVLSKPSHEAEGISL